MAGVATTARAALALQILYIFFGFFRDFFSLLDIVYSKVILIIHVRCFTHTLRVCLRARARACMCMYVLHAYMLCICVHVFMCMHNNISTFYSSRKQIISLSFCELVGNAFSFFPTCPIYLPRVFSRPLLKNCIYIS